MHDIALFSVIICTCDRYDLLPGVVESVLRQTYQPLELIIVDNSSGNSSDSAVALAFGRRYEADKKIRYVHEPVQGLSRARNKGVGLANGRIVAFIDDDAIAAPDWAEMLMAAFGDFPDAGYVGGKITPRWLAPRPEWLGNELLGYLSLVDWGGGTRKVKDSEWLAGCNIAFDRSALLKAGGFPLHLGRIGVGSALLSNEEIQTCTRIRSSGKSAVYAPRAVVEHLIPADRLTPEWFLRRSAWQAVSDFIVSPRAPEKTTLLARLEAVAAERLQRSKNFEMNLEIRMSDIYNRVTRLLSDSPNLLENLNLKDHDFLKDSLHIKI